MPKRISIALACFPAVMGFALGGSFAWSLQPSQPPKNDHLAEQSYEEAASDLSEEHFGSPLIRYRSTPYSSQDLVDCLSQFPSCKYDT